MKALGHHFFGLFAPVVGEKIGPAIRLTGSRYLDFLDRNVGGRMIFPRLRFLDKGNSSRNAERHTRISTTSTTSFVSPPAFSLFFARQMVKDRL